MRVLTLICPVLIFLLSCTAQSDPTTDWDNNAKIKGFNLVAPPQPFEEGDFDPILNLGATHVCAIPYSFCPADSPAIIFNTKWQWWGEKSEGIVTTIETAHSKGLKVILKPQIWMHHGVYTGTLSYDNEQDWVKWEKGYENYIMHFVRIADSLNVAIFCIGTELEEVVNQRPEFWNKLIKNIKANYTGQLTYAANWDEYPDVPFWKQLDFVGIDAYFPICAEKTPSVASVKKAWDERTTELSSFSGSIEKPILFTEMGYRSVDYNCKEPWTFQKVKTANTEAQKRAFKGFFTSKTWNAPWMAGICVWKWHFNDKKIDEKNTGFTPQNKPAEQVIKTYFEE